MPFRPSAPRRFSNYDHEHDSRQQYGYESGEVNGKGQNGEQQQRRSHYELRKEGSFSSNNRSPDYYDDTRMGSDGTSGNRQYDAHGPPTAPYAPLLGEYLGALSQGSCDRRRSCNGSRERRRPSPPPPSTPLSTAWRAPSLPVASSECRAWEWEWAGG